MADDFLPSNPLTANLKGVESKLMTTKGLLDKGENSINIKRA